MSEATPDTRPESKSGSRSVVTNTTNSDVQEVDIQRFVIDDPPSRVGGNLDDADQVLNCLDAAVGYFHDHLPTSVRDEINEQWGINDATIDAKRIGYTGADDGVVDFLRDQGYSNLTIARSGLVGNGGLRHVFECKPASDRRPTAFSCSHDFPRELDALSIRRYESEIEAAAIDLPAVIKCSLDAGDKLRNWWDNRIVFPYRNEVGDVTYFIGRATEQTDDIGYNDGTTAKYLKQTVNKPWVNTDAVNEPMFGCETVEEDGRLILTEGVTDAIMAHQCGFNCITPATTEFKHQHHQQLRGYAEQASVVYIVNDNDRSNVGLEKAFSTAATLLDADVEVYVGMLPRTPGQENVDLADYLSAHGPENFETLLQHAIQPFDQPALDFDSSDDQPDTGDANTTTAASKRSRGKSESTTESHEARTYRESALKRRTVVGDGQPSAIYDLKLEDVIDVRSLDIDPASANRTLYRGDNPIGHTGEDHSDYFAIYQEQGTDPKTESSTTQLRARDFKTDYSYNALTWMACACGVRSTNNPQGSLSNDEIWKVWKYAKTQDHIDIPTDDPIPLKAIWHLAEHEDLLPTEFIPTSFEDSMRLPPTTYNRVLETVVREYGINPGRKSKHSEPEEAGGEE